MAGGQGVRLEDRPEGPVHPRDCGFINSNGMEGKQMMSTPKTKKAALAAITKLRAKWLVSRSVDAGDELVDIEIVARVLGARSVDIDRAKRRAKS